MHVTLWFFIIKAEVQFFTYCEKNSKFFFFTFKKIKYKKNTWQSNTWPNNKFLEF